MATFKKGNVPWNKGLYVLLSPKSEFKPDRHSNTFKGYFRPSVSVRTNRKSEVYCTIPKKITVFNARDLKFFKSRARIPYAQFIWEKANGKKKKGTIIYHLDQDPLNNQLSNLVCITRAELLKRNREARE
jgi:hypothetical protein